MVSPLSRLSSLAREKKYKEIETILDSSDYTREAKVQEILNTNFFDVVCKLRVPKYLTSRVTRILGTDLSKKQCMNPLLKSAAKIQTGSDVLSKNANKLLRLAVKELKGTANITTMASLLRVSIRYGADHDIISDILFSRTGKNIIQDKINLQVERTPLLISILEYAIYKQASLPILKLLLTVGGRDLISLSSRSLIQGAILKYNHSPDTTEIIDLLIEYGGRELVYVASSWLIQGRMSEKKDTPLHIAYELNSRACIRALLALGGKELVLMKNIDGDTSLHSLYKYNRTELVQPLLDIGGKELVSIQNKNGDTALHTAHRFDRLDCIEPLLLIGGKGLTLMKNNRGFTVLHSIYLSSKLSCVDQLLDVGGKELTLAKDKDGCTALHILCRYNRPFICVQKLLDIGGKELTLAKNNDGYTALHILCKHKRYSCIEKLLDVGGKELALAPDKMGNCALHLLKKEDIADSQSIQRLIMEGGSEILDRTNERNKEAFTPLLAGAFKSMTEKSKNKDASCSDSQDKQESMENLKSEMARVEKLLEAEKNRGQLEADTAKYRYEHCLKDIALLEDVNESQKKDLNDQKKIIEDLESELFERNSEVEELKSELQKAKAASEQLKDTTIAQKKVIEEQEATSTKATIRMLDFEKEESYLKQEVKFQKKVIEKKDQENLALRQEIERMRKKMKSISKRTTRTRDESSDIDCVLEEDEDNESYTRRTKRSRCGYSASSLATRSGIFNQFESLECENEDLLQQLQQEKTNHLSTLRRLDSARNELKRK